MDETRGGENIGDDCISRYFLFMYTIFLRAAEKDLYLKYGRKPCQSEVCLRWCQTERPVMAPQRRCGN
ncbi:hypothetical protein Y032_0163g3496 [Ancylostoma ceylanicum]|uniref:Uncharacterized protein n=1 Tax=Ancylostoma ceylanicum TaxID=53326 RepID=A0A016SWS4_9BILA|nr:hypothetical protein Y032_0163g3496 [Ancylostoma ceylanicum]